jgi:hypothetical protein
MNMLEARSNLTHLAEISSQKRFYRGNLFLKMSGQTDRST